MKRTEFLYRSSGFSTQKQWVFSSERTLLRLRTYTASDPKIQTFLPKHTVVLSQVVTKPKCNRNLRIFY